MDINLIPADGLAGLKKHWKDDLLSGFVISLIALPLCLGIAMASGVPPMAGIIAGIIGGLLVSLTSGSYLTINGPAAGLAVIVLMSMEGFKKMAPAGLTPEQIEIFAYQCTLAVGIGCGVLQLLFGFIKAGVLSNFFPSSVVHGMLAAIGIMIFAKQFHTAVGVKPDAKSMLGIIGAIPNSLLHMNPEIAIISVVSLLILIGLPMIKHPFAKKIPAPLLVILVTIPLGHYFNLESEHKYLFLDGHEYNLGPKFLVSLPENFLDGIVLPRFDYLLTGFGIQMMITYSLVSSLESLLTAAAVDKLDPYKRTSNFNRELFAKGSGNMASSFLGGLPIIAEVVRSSANVSNGAKTRWANFFHGAFLLIFVVFLSSLIHQIPLAALASMLMVTGYRLASPHEFSKTLHLGKEQLLIFVTTIVVTIADDLLVGIAAGIVMKIVIHMANGVPFKSLFKPFLTVNEDESGNYVVDVEHSAVFSNFIGMKKQLEKLEDGRTLILDFSGTNLVDSSSRENFEQMKKDYEKKGGNFILRGLDDHTPLSSHPKASLKKKN
ncbi:MAG: STAS domain-containing protein [Bacteroidia bacterium]|nr:STAS domain-containing protein [Bacteroidia bacterium]MCF8426376.1 STAS domain-containing protein [Bacteroidia bacterium]